MMKNQKINIIQQFTAWLFCLIMLSQHAVNPPVLCLESDGRINIEAGCDNTCDIPKPDNNEHQDDCVDCVDIPFGKYNPDLTFISGSLDLDEYGIYQEQIFDDYADDYGSDLHVLNYSSVRVPPFLKSTILLI